MARRQLALCQAVKHALTCMIAASAMSGTLAVMTSVSFQL